MGGRLRYVLLAGSVVLGLAGPVGALDSVDFRVSGAPDDLVKALQASSLLLQAQREGRTGAQDIFAAAQADYGRLLGRLYESGRYSGVISIRIDGREAADIAPLDAPARIGTVTVTVEPGREFRFGRAEIGPLAGGTVLPRGFAGGAPAPSGLIRATAEASVAAWRDAGHAKAAVAGQAITADHARGQLDARITVSPGPVVRFGAITFAGAQRMREDRLRAIAGFPQGATFSPALVARSAERLRRTGVFRSVALTEADRLGPGETLDIAATLQEEAPRRIGFGAEISSFDGINLSGYWMHRNLLGGAERLRIEAEVEQIGARRSGTDYRLGVSYGRPATLTPDTTLELTAEVARIDDEDQKSDIARAGLSFTHVFSERLTARAGLEYRAANVTDRVGRFQFRNIAVPIGVTWDRRDDRFDARRGTYLDAELRPFRGFSGTGSGARIMVDARAYRDIGPRFVIAGRVQAGAVVGPTLLRTPRDYLFYSGGGGSVRGQPYQSLGVNVLRADQKTGGTHYIGASLELRAKMSERIGLVAFYDYGNVSAVRFLDSSGGSHAGAGIGLRYATGLGPIRLDVAAPVSGTTGRGVQVYVGIGQAF